VKKRIKTNVACHGIYKSSSDGSSRRRKSREFKATQRLDKGMQQLLVISLYKRHASKMTLPLLKFLCALNLCKNTVCVLR